MAPDELWTDGNYYVRNANTPFGQHGFLRVYSSGELRVQEFIPFDAAAGTYAMRHKNYNVATDWVIIASNTLKTSDIYIRTGNIVECSAVNVWMNKRPVPIGFRPAGMRHFTMMDQTIGAPSGLYYENGAIVSADHNFSGTAVWITTDAMPA